MNERGGEKGVLRKSFDQLNYHWSNLTWRIGLGLTAWAALTGSLAGVASGGVFYWWDRRSIRQYKKEHGKPLEPINSWLDRLNPHKGSNRFSSSSTRMAMAAA